MSLRFAILSNPHLHDARLGTGGRAFDAYLAENPNLLALSEAILEAVLAKIRARRVDFVIISGDLTKDGEIANHRFMARHLGHLEHAGIPVYVVPGNHDLNNPDAAAYSGDSATLVPSANPELFRRLYHRFGYGTAIDHAPDSLSYVAEPAPGLLLLALDSVKSEDNARAPHPLVSGRLTPPTLQWALDKLQQAQANGKSVVAFMHHGVNPHFLAQPRIFPEYLVDDWSAVGAHLAAAGLKVIFTGHYHSQDAAWPQDARGAPQPETLCDIETASLVMWPCAYRMAELDSNRHLHVESRRVTSIAADLGGVPFPQHAEAVLRTLLPGQVETRLQHLFGLTDDQIQRVQPLMVDALMANYAGDEHASAETLAALDSLAHSPEPYHTIGELIGTLWTDLPPPDNQLVVPLGD